MELTIAIIGAIISIIIALSGAFLSLRNSIVLRTRDLKEKYYTDYFEKLHNLASNNSAEKSISEYTKARDQLFIIASENVVKALLNYEELAVGKANSKHDDYLTNLVKEIRKDLRIKDKSYPKIYLIKK